MWLTGSKRLAEAEPGFAELAAALEALLIDGSGNVFDPGDAAVILGKPADDLRRVFARATDPAIDLLTQVEMVVCETRDCGGLNVRDRVEAELAENGESDCSRCGVSLDLATARIQTKDDLTETTSVEVRELEQRPRKRVLILTALAVEQAAVLAPLTDIREVVEGGTVYNQGCFESRKTIWTVAAAQVGAGTAFAAAGTAKALLDFKPEVALFVGIAGGLKDDVDLGDVVAADKVHGYEPGKAARTFIPRPEQMRGAYPLVQRALEVARLGVWIERIAGTPPPPPKAIVAEIASGDKVVASHTSALYQMLRSSFDRCVAVEMEGIGFHVANYIGGVEGLVIRGISDMVEHKAETDRAGWQKRAAAHAAAFAYELLATL